MGFVVAALKVVVFLVLALFGLGCLGLVLEKAGVIDPPPAATPAVPAPAPPPATANAGRAPTSAQVQTKTGALPSAPTSPAPTESDPRLRVDYDTLEASALRGNYQSQRNIAYLLKHSEQPLFPRNPILACAWRLVILNSGSTQVAEGDIGNKRIDCERDLATDEQLAAVAQAEKLVARMKGR